MAAMRLSARVGRGAGAAGRRDRGQRRTRCARPPAAALVEPGGDQEKVTTVYKFGGSSVRDADRMREVAKIVCQADPSAKPALVLSAMGKTTNNLLAAGLAALEASPEDIPSLPVLEEIRQLHADTMTDLGVDDETRADVNRLLQNLEQLLTGIALMEELTARTSDNLVSFGERCSTRIFAGYLRAEGVPAKQYDSFDVGFVTTDDFKNGDILPVTYERLAETLGGPKDHIPVITGFLGRGVESGAITTLGRGGSDLSATVVAKALALPEAVVWKDVDGVLTGDPRIVESAVPVPVLTYDEATELAYFGAQVLHPQAMRPAVESENLVVRVKNSYNVTSPGTVICRERAMDDTLLTSIVRKKNITMLDIVSSRMLGQFGFLSRVFSVMESHGISVDVVATSEISVSLTLDPAKIWSRDLVPEELARLKADFDQIAQVKVSSGHSIISLVCNASRSSELLKRAFRALDSEEITVQMISQGASKTNISLLVNDDEGDRAVRAIHAEFFEHDGAPCSPRTIHAAESAAHDGTAPEPLAA